MAQERVSSGLQIRTPEETLIFVAYFLSFQGSNEKLAVINPLVSAIFFTVTPE
jgi:hypothetical protein